MNKIFITLFLFLMQINLVSANSNIAFIDMDKIISTSKPGLLLINQLKVKADKNSNKFKKNIKKLKEQETKLISQKNIISESEFINKVELLKKEINEHNQNRNKSISNFNKLKIENTNKLLKLINPILVKFSNDNEISFILQKKELIIGKTEFDITDDILKIINNDIKKFNIN
tara:strand:- start:282 stop:800 length:519 start_codon:yes stop_codon:yes gene_type:complete